MVDMIATKGLKYGTRRLIAGDAFEARHERDARLLIGIGKARYATRDAVAFNAPKPAPVAPVAVPATAVASDDPVDTATAPLAEAAESDERPALRDEYEVKLGKKPFPGWSAETLREKIAAADADDA